MANQSPEYDLPTDLLQRKKITELRLEKGRVRKEKELEQKISSREYRENSCYFRNYSLLLAGKT